MTIALTSTTKKILWIVLQVVVVIVITTAIALFMRTKIIHSSTQLFNSRLTILTNQSQQERAVRLQEQFKAVQPYMYDLYALAPLEESLISFRAALDALPARAGVTAASLQFDQSEPVVAVPPFKKTNFTLVVRASLDRFFVYLEHLEALPFLITIASIDASGGAGLASDAQFTIKGELYMQ